MSDSVMFLSVSRLILSWYIPRWYLTSPEPCGCRKGQEIKLHLQNAFPHCRAAAVPSPHQQPLTWGQTDRRSDPGPYGSRWPRHSVDPWKRGEFKRSVSKTEGQELAVCMD